MVDFPVALLQHNNRLYMQIPYQAVSWTTFLLVFDNMFWVVLLIVTLGLSVVLYALLLLAKRDRTTTFGLCFATVYCSFLSLSIPVEAKRVPSRCLVLTVCLAGALTFWSYNAGLVSLLTVEHFIWPIR